MSTNRLRVTAPLAMIAVVSSLVALVGLGATAAQAAYSPDVVYVHGAGCGAIQYTVTAMRAEEAFTGRSPASLHTVAYYSCDTVGDSIRNEGSSYYLPSADNGTDTEVARISYELAWYLWNNYGSRGRPVDLVGHSMGGIIVTYALQRIAAHDPNYPRSLTVDSVVTVSSPFDGVSTSLCAQSPSVECSNLLAGSSLIRQIDTTGAVRLGTQTVWTSIGSDGADQFPSASTLALPGTTNRYDFTSPAYTHTGYMVDTSTQRNAHGTLNGARFSYGQHSLALLASLLN